MANIASSAQTAGTFGFYAGLKVEHDKETSSTQTGYTVGKGSTLTSNGGMSLGVAGQDFSMTGGSITNTAGNLDINAANATFQAGKTTTDMTFGQEHSTQSLDTQIGAGYFQQTLSANQQNSAQSSGTVGVNNLVIVNSGTTVYNVDNLNLIGAESYAQRQDLTNAKNVTIESLQDTAHSDNSSSGWNVSATWGTAGSGQAKSDFGNEGLGINNSHGNATAIGVNRQAALIGTEDIVGNIDELNLKGGQVAVVGTDGVMGTAHLTAQTMNLENVSSTDKATQDGFSVGANFNNSPTRANALQNQNANAGKNGLPEIGGGSFGISQGGYTKEGYTQNFVGAGITAGATTGTGTQTQDLAQANVQTKNESRGGLNANIDSRVAADLVNLVGTTNYGAVLTDKNGYVGGKLNDIAGLSQAGKAWDRIETAAEDVGRVVDGVVNGKVALGEAVNVIGTSKIGTLRDAQEAKAKDKEYASIVNDLLGDGRTASDVQSVLTNEVNGTAALLGGDTQNPDGTQKQVMVYDNVEAGKEMMHTPSEGDVNKNNIAGLTDSETHNVGINLQNTQLQNGVEVERITAHEGAHEAGFGEGIASIMGDTAASVWEDQNKLNGRTTNNSSDPVTTQINWLNSQHEDPVQNAIIEQGNQFVSNVGDGDPYRAKISGSDKYVYIQQIPGKPGQFRSGVTTEKEGFYIDPAPNGLEAKQTITFKNDDPRGKSPDQRVSLKLAETIENAAITTGYTLNINSTIGGTHSLKSDHYASPGRAADINLINGKRVEGNETGSVEILQKFFAQDPKVREDFGPEMKVKRYQPGQEPVQTPSVPDHTNHIHVSVQK